MRLSTGIFAAIVALAAQSVAAQDYRAIEEMDSTDIAPLGAISGGWGSAPAMPGWRVSPYVDAASLPADFLRFSPANETFLTWLDVSSSRQSMPGLMGIESVTATARLEAGNLSIEPHAHAVKYGYMHGLQTSFGVGATISYSISSRLSVTAFGTYFTPAHAPSPAIAGFMQTSRFGGYATWRISERWSLSAGAQAISTPCAINKWQAVPIIMPTFHVNDKVSLGVDLGGILYDIAESIIDKNRTAPGPAFVPSGGGPQKSMFSGGDPSQAKWNQ